MSASYVNNNQNYDYFQKFFVYNENKKTDPNFHQEQVSKWERKTFEALLNYNMLKRNCFQKMKKLPMRQAAATMEVTG